MIVKAEAIVLKSRKQGETSKVLTLYTKEFGKISAMVKGARSKNNKFGGSLEVLNHISIVFYKYQNKELKYVSQSSIINNFSSILTDYDKTMNAMAILEIVNNVLHDEEENENFFNLIKNSLLAIDKFNKNIKNVFIYFNLHLALQFGFQLNFENCMVCNKQLDDKYSSAQNKFNQENGSVICSDCKDKILLPLKNISLISIRISQKFLSSDIFQIENINIQPNIFSEISDILFSYLIHHIEGMKKLKSLEIFKRLSI